MNRNGPIIILEDDIDDQELLTEAFKNLKYSNELMFFVDGHRALEFLNDSDITPFLILSDINLPKLDGFALRNKIRMDAKLQLRCIPYLLFSTALKSGCSNKCLQLICSRIFYEGKFNCRT